MTAIRLGSDSNDSIHIDPRSIHPLRASLIAFSGNRKYIGGVNSAHYQQSGESVPLKQPRFLNLQLPVRPCASMFPSMHQHELYPPGLEELRKIASSAYNIVYSYDLPTERLVEIPWYVYDFNRALPSHASSHESTGSQANW